MYGYDKRTILVSNGWKAYVFKLSDGSYAYEIYCPSPTDGGRSKIKKGFDTRAGAEMQARNEMNDWLNGPTLGPIPFLRILSAMVMQKSVLVLTGKKLRNWHKKKISTVPLEQQPLIVEDKKLYLDTEKTKV